MKSLKRAIRFSLMPHELGYCGPEDINTSKVILRNYLLNNEYLEEKIRSLLDEFVGAISYYRLIAEKNNIKDPYDGRVIDAYWLGNDLLNAVSVEDIKEMMWSNFVGEGKLTKERCEEIISTLPDKAYAHHTFHIFFIGAVTNKVKLEGDNKDKCRPSWAEVIGAPADGKIKVKISKLFPDEKMVEEYVIYDPAFVSDLKIGDNVVCHWGRISDRITDSELENLKKYTMFNYRVRT